jgi:hypothetical protein
VVLAKAPIRLIERKVLQRAFGTMLDALRIAAAQIAEKGRLRIGVHLDAASHAAVNAQPASGALGSLQKQAERLLISANALRGANANTRGLDALRTSRRHIDLAAMDSADREPRLRRVHFAVVRLRAPLLANAAARALVRICDKD